MTISQENHNYTILSVPVQILICMDITMAVYYQLNPETTVTTKSQYQNICSIVSFILYN